MSQVKGNRMQAGKKVLNCAVVKKEQGQGGAGCRRIVLSHEINFSIKYKGLAAKLRFYVK
jgi:hypothetical protein